MTLLHSKKMKCLLVGGLIASIILCSQIQGEFPHLQMQKQIYLEKGAIPASNSYDEISSYLIVEEACEAIAIWGDEVWGVLHSNGSIALLSAESGEIIRCLPSIGITPAGLAANEDKIFLSGRDGIGNGTIFLLDKTTGIILDSFDVFGSDSFAFGLEYDNGYLWMDQTNETRGDNYLLKVNAETGAIMINFSSPVPITAGPQINGLVFCVAYDSNDILGFDQETGQIVCNFSYPAVSNGDWGCSQQRGNLVLSNYLSTNFYFIRTTQYATGETVFNIDIDGRYGYPFRAANNGTHLIIRPEYTYPLKILEIGTGNEVGEISLSFNPYGFTYANDYLWLSDLESPYHIHKIGLDGTEISSFSLGLTSNQQIIDLAHDGTFLWGMLINRTMIKIDPVAQSIIEYVEVGSQINCMDYSSETGRILGCTSNDAHAIFVFNPANGEIEYENTISVSTSTITGITIWQDKIILVGSAEGLDVLAYIQNNHEFDISSTTGGTTTSSTTDGTTTSSTNSLSDDEIPLLFGFNAYYIAGGGVIIGAVVGMLLGGLLFGKKKK